MKKIISFLLILVSIFLLTAVPISAQNEIKVILDGTIIEFEQPPAIINDRTMVPMRAIYEALGAEVAWDAERRTASGAKMGIIVSFTIDEPMMKINFVEKTIDSPATIVNDRTMIPLRAVAEGFGVNVEWDGSKRTVYLSDSNSTSVIENFYYDGEYCKYLGNIDGDVPHGYGTTVYDNESAFIGKWERGVFLQGVIRTISDDGTEITIEYLDGETKGYTIIRKPNGEYYEGFSKNGKFNGLGEYYWNEGENYIGEWKNDLFHGYGIYVNKEYGFTYDGYWEDGKMNGSGTMIMDDGNLYEGNFLDNNFNGYGEYIWADGSYYKGYFKNNNFHGQGILYTAETGSILSGEFVDGEYVDTVPYSNNYYEPSYATPETSDIYVTFPLHLYSNDGRTYLGKLVTSKYDTDSVFNEYGTYGSSYSSNSIWNKYGKYGSQYSLESINNEYATRPPQIVDNNGKFVGYLTENKYMKNGYTLTELRQILSQYRQ